MPSGFQCLQGYSEEIVRDISEKRYQRRDEHVICHTCQPSRRYRCIKRDTLQLIKCGNEFLAYSICAATESSIESILKLVLDICPCIIDSLGYLRQLIGSRGYRRPPYGNRAEAN